jgi:hypothetical protein
MKNKHLLWTRNNIITTLLLPLGHIPFSPYPGQAPGPVHVGVRTRRRVATRWLTRDEEGSKSGTVMACSTMAAPVSVPPRQATSHSSGGLASPPNRHRATTSHAAAKPQPTQRSDSLSAASTIRCIPTADAEEDIAPERAVFSKKIQMACLGLRVEI